MTAVLAFLLAWATLLVGAYLIGGLIGAWLRARL